MENNNKHKEDCPYCQLSEEAVEKLKSADSETKNFKAEKEEPSKKPSIKKKKCLVFLVFLVIIGGFAAYGFWSGFPSFFQKTEVAQDKIVQNQPAVVAPEDISLAPDFTSQDIFGNEVSLSDFRGRSPVLLAFWATWCGFCTKELPDLIAFTQKYQGEVVVLAIDSGESKETISNYYLEKGVNFSMILDEKRKIWNKYSVRGTPSHFLIDKKGKIIATWPGLALMNQLESLFELLD
jgi:peroxiredoxin